MKKYLYSGGAVALGAVGFGLRRWQLATCFQEGRLVVPGLATNLLVGLTVLAAVLFAVMAFPLEGKAKNWSGAFGSKPSPLLRVAALGYLAAAITFLVEIRTIEPPSSMFEAANVILPAILGVGLFGSAVAVWLTARTEKPEPAAVMVPGFSSCFWLVSTYHANANEPAVMEFAWLLLAVVASIWAWYEVAGFSLENGRSRMALFWSLMTVTLSMISIASEEALYVRLLLGTQALWFAVQSARLAGEMEFVGWKRPLKKPEDPPKGTSEAGG